MMTKTPRQLGYRMPAEWTKHTATWLVWPHDVDTFPQRLGMVEVSYCAMIKALHGSERVELLVLNDAMRSRVIQLLQEQASPYDHVTFHVTDYADVWIRDYGPTFLNQGAWVKWQYNAYGKTDEPYFAVVLKDNDIFDRLNPGGQKFCASMVLEGGSIEVNGAGIVVTTKQCLLNPNRNPHLSQKQIEECLKNYLGADQTIWLERGLINDHTDGHIDDIAKFVGPHTILCAYESDSTDANYPHLSANYEVLKQYFEVVQLPMPHLQYDDGTKAPVSYANFYIANTVVLVPTYNDPNDRKALELIQSYFPERQVVGIPAQDIIYGGGAIHCITQQQPALQTK